MTHKNIILVLLFLFFLASCKKVKSNSGIAETNLKTICNSDSLIKWSSKIIEERKQDFVLSNETNINTIDEGNYVSVVWKYDVNSKASLNDEFIQYCLDLIRNEVQIPESFNLKFDYILNASCPIDTDLPIEVNSEIENLSLIDNTTFTQYDFDIIRGRLDSAIKYLKESPNKVTDTIYLTY